MTHSLTKGKTETASSWAASSSSFFMGNVGGYVPDDFDDFIDEVAFYSRALSDEEVLNSHCAIEALVGSDLEANGCL